MVGVEGVLHTLAPHRGEGDPMIMSETLSRISFSPELFSYHKYSTTVSARTSIWCADESVGLMRDILSEYSLVDVATCAYPHERVEGVFEALGLPNPVMHIPEGPDAARDEGTRFMSQKTTPHPQLFTGQKI